MSPPTNQDHVWQNRAEMALASATSLGQIVTYAEMADAADIPALSPSKQNIILFVYFLIFLK